MAKVEKRDSLVVEEMENKEVKEGNIEIEKMEDELSNPFKRKKGGIITMPSIFGKLATIRTQY